MPPDAELCYLSIAALGRAYTGGELSPVEVVEAFLRRIERLDGRLNSYLTVTADLALATARDAEQRFQRGEARGLLDGVPIGLKDIFDTAGVRTTAHSELYAERVPDSNAATVERLARAGAPLLGKHALHEFAAGSPHLNGFFPPARNPWNLERVPSGSSSGSAAAVAAGLCAGALGSDTGGSIRGPAAYCGVVGLKPSAGLISRFGVIPLSWTLDHVGPLARTVEDAAILLEGLAGHDPRDPASLKAQPSGFRAGLGRDLVGLHIGAPLDFVSSIEDLHPETLSAYHQALTVLESLGAEVRPVELPLVEHSLTVSSVLRAAEALAFHERDARTQPEKYGASFYKILAEGALLSATDYLQAQQGRTLFRQSLARLMASVDLLALPTRPHPARDFASEVASPIRERVSLTGPFNISGQPAISIPAGFSSEQLPIGLQLVGRWLEDSTVLAAAWAYEQQTGWHAAHPPLS